jgi:hypothetical protein
VSYGRIFGIPDRHPRSADSGHKPGNLRAQHNAARWKPPLFMSLGRGSAMILRSHWLTLPRSFRWLSLTPGT